MATTTIQALGATRQFQQESAPGLIPHTPRAVAHAELPHTNLDMLRALAVMCVFISHALMANLVETPWMGSLGQSGVMIFFVHTALVLINSFEKILHPSRLYPRELAWRKAVTAFGIRRIWRLYPLAWVMIGVTLVLSVGFNIPITEPDTNYITSNLTSWSSIFAIGVNLLQLQTVFGVPSIEPVMWTLTLEVQMYLALPWCYKLIQKFGTKGVLSALVLSTPPSLILYWHSPLAIHFKILGFVPCFLCGCLAYAILLKRKPGSLRIPASWWFFTIMAVLLVQVFLVVNPTRPICLAIGLLIPFFAPAPEHWLLTRWAAKIAQYSYGIYLTHGIALAIAFNWLKVPYLFQWPIFMVLAVLFAYASYHWIERPAQVHGQRLAERFAS